MKRSFDVCVIGGGLIGMCCALELARDKLKVCVVESGRCGREASWAAGGILTPIHLADYPPPLVRLGSLSMSMYPEFVKEVEHLGGVNTEYFRTGLIMPIRNEHDVQEVKKLVRFKQKHGDPYEKLTARDALKAEPELSKDIRGALLVPDVMQIRNNRLCRGLGLALKSLNVELMEHTPCIGLETTKGRAGVKTPSGTIKAGEIIVAAGAWSGGIAPVDVTPVRGQIALTEAAPTSLRHMLLITSMGAGTSGPGRDIYLIPRLDGKILIGSTVEHVGFKNHVTLEGLGFLMQGAMEIMPGLRDLNLLGSWSGLRPSGPKRVPTIGRLKAAKNLIAAVGHYRNGILLAPATGRLVRDLVRGEKGEIDPKPFAPK